MICKKCGDNIPDTAKFCGNCGEKTIQLEIKNDIEQEINIKNSKNKKKNNFWIFILGGIIIGLTILVFIFLLFTNNKTSEDVKNLKKAFDNFLVEGKDSGTINIKMLIETNSSDTYNLNSNIKYKRSYDAYNVLFALDKSLLLDEINIYSTVYDDNVILYLNSNLIDKMGLTQSPENLWMYYILNLNNISFDNIFNIYELLNNKNYKYIDEENNIKHYELILDNELLNNIKIKLIEEGFQINDAQNIDLKEPQQIDVYIKNNKFVKISTDLTKNINNLEITKFIINIEFNNIGNTQVEIPYDVQKTIVDLKNYMSNYSIILK